MASEEDRLDQLLKAARQQLGEEPEEETAEQADDQSDRDASMPSFKEIAREFEEAEMEDAITDAVSGLNEVSLDEVTSGTQAILDSTTLMHLSDGHELFGTSWSKIAQKVTEEAKETEDHGEDQ